LSDTLRSPDAPARPPKGLYNAIEEGVADVDDPAFKGRIDGLKAIRDQAKADAPRAQAMIQKSGDHAIMQHILSEFARAARQRIRLEGSGYCREILNIRSNVIIYDRKRKDSKIKTLLKTDKAAHDFGLIRT
jgi:hypothetical protein